MALITTPSAQTVIGCAITVHRELGAGLFESVYGPCLAHEMTKAGLMFMREVAFPLTYDGLSFERSCRADFVVENELLQRPEPCAIGSDFSEPAPSFVPFEPSEKARWFSPCLRPPPCLRG